MWKSKASLIVEQMLCDNQTGDKMEIEGYPDVMNHSLQIKVAPTDLDPSLLHFGAALHPKDLHLKTLSFLD